jgi:hypothetical protein
MSKLYLGRLVESLSGNKKLLTNDIKKRGKI